MSQTSRTEGFASLRQILEQLQSQPGGFPVGLRHPVVHQQTAATPEYEDDQTLEAA
jgi:hypothetical protein